MRKTRYLLAGLVLLSAAACGRSPGITEPGGVAAPRGDGTPIVGSGTAAGTMQGDTTSRIGNGMVGSGA
jgi:hypothetical protein